MINIKFLVLVLFLNEVLGLPISDVPPDNNASTLMLKLEEKENFEKPPPSLEHVESPVKRSTNQMLEETTLNNKKDTSLTSGSKDLEGQETFYPVGGYWWGVRPWGGWGGWGGWGRPGWHGWHGWHRPQWGGHWGGHWGGPWGGRW